MHSCRFQHKTFRAIDSSVMTAEFRKLLKKNSAFIIKDPFYMSSKYWIEIENLDSVRIPLFDMNILASFIFWHFFFTGHHYYFKNYILVHVIMFTIDFRLLNIGVYFTQNHAVTIKFLFPSYAQCREILLTHINKVYVHILYSKRLL